MSISARELNRATLGRQLLLRREALDVSDAVRRVVALQAQQPASSYLALWNRLAAFDPVDLDTAFADRTLVKATLLRSPCTRCTRTTIGRCTQPCGRHCAAPGSATLVSRRVDEVQAWLDTRYGIRTKGVWWALRSVSPLLYSPTGGPWSFGAKPSYVAAAAPPAPRDMDTPDGCLQTVVRRYLEGFGPASVADVAQFAMVRRSRVRDAVLALSGKLEQLEGPDGTELLDVPGAPRPLEDTPAPPRLMAMWDSVLLAYADRSRVVPPDYRKLVTRSNGDVLPTLLVDGYVVGVWRPVDGGIEATAFHRLPAQVWDGLAAEARALVALLADRESRVYRRYDRWWAELPRAEVRILPG